MGSQILSGRELLFIYPPPDYALGLGNQERALSVPEFLPPLGILYLAASLLEVGCSVEVIDFNVERYSRNKLRQHLRGKALVGMSVLSFNRRAASVIAQEIKAARPELAVIAGGPDLTLRPTLLPGTDVTVIGEAEQTIVPLVRQVLSHGSLSDFEGVMFRNPETGEIHHGKDPIPQRNLDALRFPARHLVDRQKYSMFGRLFAGKSASVVSSRGCPFQCRFCSRNAMHYMTYRARHAENVVDELQALYNSGYEVVLIGDDNFLVNKKRVHRIMDGLLNRGVHLMLIVLGRVELANEELFQKMVAAGVRFIQFGLEAADQDTLDYYGKKTSVEQNQAAVEMADRCGMYVHGFFIIGAPMESRAHIEHTTEFAQQLPLDTVFFNILSYEYGSALWQEAYDCGLVGEHEYSVMADSARGLSQFTASELERFRRHAYLSFFARPSYWIRQVEKARRLDDPRATRYLAATALMLAKGVIAKYGTSRVLRAFHTAKNACRLDGRRRPNGKSV